MTLVSLVACEVKSVDVSIVISFRKFTLGDLVGMSIGLHVSLSLRKRCLEVSSVSSELRFRLGVNQLLGLVVLVITNLSKSKGVLVRVTVLTIELVVLLVFANVCLPAKISFVDARNKQVHLI